MADSKTYPSKWKSFWFWTSLLAVIIALAALVALIWIGSAKEWFAERFSGVYTPAGAVLVAALASLGAALNYYHQAKDRHDRETEEANHKREAALWERFHKAAEAFGTKDRDLVGIRQAGVYALCGVGDDWVRYRRALGDEKQALKNEVETIADLLCAQLRRKAHIPESGMARGAFHENESQVNDAIISQFAVRLNVQHGTWKELGLVLDLHGADLTKSLWANLDLRQAIFVDADMRDIDLQKSLLAGADLTRAQIEKADITGSGLTPSQLAKADLGLHGFVDNTPPPN